MASYHLSVKTVSRATGRSGPGAAAYRTASLIQCERDGTTHDYTRRSGVEASFIVAPLGADWAQDRAALWNAVEAAGDHTGVFRADRTATHRRRSGQPARRDKTAEKPIHWTRDRLGLTHPARPLYSARFATSVS